MSDAEIRSLRERLKPRTNKYVNIGWENKRQIVFLILNDVREILYGGEAGGGKSSGLLAAAAQYVDVPRYSAILFRRKFSDLALPGALISRSKEWWGHTDARYNDKEHKWEFPSGATIQFGYMEHDGDELRYQSAEFQFVGFDELTQIKEHQYRYMYSRLRRLEGVDIPLRMRSATNPGGPGHEWVRKRWNLPYGPGPEYPNRIFLPAGRYDNPYLDHEEYEESLNELDELQYAQLAEGDWSATGSGGIFDPQAFVIMGEEDLPAPKFRGPSVRHWDFGSSDKTTDNPDPDRTAGAKVGKIFTMPESIAKYFQSRNLEPPKPPYWVIYDIQKTDEIGNPGAVEQLVTAAAAMDGMIVPQSFEQERGASGKHTVHMYQKYVLPGYKVMKLWARGSKPDRAKVVAQASAKGQVFLLDGDWVEGFLYEAGAFGIKGVHDDQVDAVSGGFEQLERLEFMSVDDQVDQEA